MKHLTFTAAVNASLCSLAMVLTLGFATTSHAQLIGYTAELDTMLWETESGDDPLAGLAYYGVYNVYANLTSATDVVSSVYSDVAALDTPPMGIDAGCGCHNPPKRPSLSTPATTPPFSRRSPITNTIRSGPSA